MTARGRSENTIRAYIGDLELFLAYAGPVIPQDDFNYAATNWLNQHRAVWSPKTATRRLTSLRQFAKWSKWMADDLAEYRPPIAGKAMPHPLPEGLDGVRRMIAAAEPNRKVQALIGLCGLAGLRCAEALSVGPDAFDGPQRALTVRGKGDRTRVVPLSPEAWSVVNPARVDALIDSDRLGFMPMVVGYKDRFARHAITTAGLKAGLSRHVSSHDLRATFATAMYDQSLNLRAVQEVLGHANMKTTEGYTEIPLSTLRSALPK